MNKATRTRLCSAILLVLASVSGALAQEPGVSARTEIVVKSKALGDRTVYVVTPEGYGSGRARYPVVVMLDANDLPMFQLAIANAWYLTRNEPSVPPVIVVGIPNGADRLHDMLPPASGSSVAQFPTAGGADAFHDFITEEVLPTVRARYRTLPTTILIGHSAGGLFGLYVAATRPGSFRAIIVTSPALWYNDSTPATTYADAIARSPSPLRLFAASGPLDPLIDFTTRHLAARLDSLRPAQVAFAHRQYLDDTHQMTPISGLAEGLRFAFDPVVTRRLPIADLEAGDDSLAVVQALLTSETRYAESARSLLMPEELPAVALNRVGYFALRTLNHSALATWVFERNLSHHPESLGARNGLADVYLARGDTAAAIAQLRKAEEVARSIGTPWPEVLREKLTQLEGRRRARRPTPPEG